MFSKTLKDGRTATITPDPNGTLNVHIDGTLHTNGHLRQLAQPKGPITHAIGNRNPLGLTAAEATELQQLLADRRNANRATRLATTTGQREELARLLGSASATWQALRTEAVNTGEGWSKVGPAEQAMNTAQANLDAFDADHS